MLVAVKEASPGDAEKGGNRTLLSSIKRPKHLFGGLPLLATIRAECASAGDSMVFAVRSPLSGKQSLAEAPSPFWCALEAAGDEEEARINMQMELARFEFSTVPMHVGDGQPKKKRKGTVLAVTFPVLVNSKPLKKGDTLLFRHGTQFLAVAEDADAKGTEEKGDSAEQASADKAPAPPPPSPWLPIVDGDVVCICRGSGIHSCWLQFFSGGGSAGQSHLAFAAWPISLCLSFPGQCESRGQGRSEGECQGRSEAQEVSGRALSAAWPLTAAVVGPA